MLEDMIDDTTSESCPIDMDQAKIAGIERRQKLQHFL
jgi:hypothetical protein